MKENRPVILFDSQGRPYRFASADELARHRVDARLCAGLAAAKGSAPPEVVGHRPDPGGPEVGGRHLSPDAEFYHTDWQWGALEFGGQDGIVGTFFCCHAHFSRTDARAYYDPSCEMLQLADA